MEEVLNTILNGLSLGGIYALIALGYTMVYGIAKLLNFAHGDLIMVSAYAIFVSISLHLNPIIAIIIAIILCVILAVLIERVAYRPLRGATPIAVLITAIGVSYLMESICFIIFGSSPKIIDLFPNLSSQQVAIITLAAAAAIMIMLTIFIKFTKVGKSMLAVSQDRNAAELMGISANKTIVITFIIGSVLAAVAGVFYLMSVKSATYTMGSLPGIKAFTAAVIGGIGSIPGAMIGGLILGLIEAICTSIPAISNFTIAIEFGVLIIILLVRPNGILGKKLNEKV